MKRLHLHVSVDNLEQSIQFYNALFGHEPNKVESDYARWLLDEPALNFAISNRAAETGIKHLGIQVEDDAELYELRERMKQADLSLFNEGETVCCYAYSDKSWIKDPSGIAWEAYRTMADAQTFTSPTTGKRETSSQRSCC